ncbi:MAG: ornithine cyclodeaminase family protein [Pseudomonadota bacterium]
MHNEDRDIPFLREAEVASVLKMSELIPAMEQALVDYSGGRISQPDRQMLPVTKAGGFFGAMPAVGESVGVKLVNFFPGNAQLDLPTHLALILLFKPETGEPLAIMDGRLITEMRTSAVSAAVLNKIAPAKPKVLAILGAGLQAKTHIEALAEVREFEEVRVWARSSDKAKAFAEEVGATAMAAEDAVRDADVVVTATASKEPILQGSWLKPGAVVAAVGWNSRDGRELDDDAMRNVVIVESRSGTEKESGNIRGAQAAIFAEAGEILDGTKTIEEGATVVFDSIGMAAEDVASAELVWKRFQEQRS